MLVTLKIFKVFFFFFRFNYNFGALGLMDWIHGTDKAFKKNVASKRNFRILGFNSARELVPDELEDKKLK